MKIKIKAISVLVLMALTITSCNDWLTVEPEGQLLKDNFWKTTEDVNAALTAMYNAQQGLTEKNLIWGELRADMYTMGSNYGNYQLIAESNIAASNGAVSWSQYYKTINLANTLMYYNKEVVYRDDGQGGKIGDATFTKELMDQMDAEAMFIRSLNHFYLVRLWRDVPLMKTASISDTSSIFTPKSTEAEVLRFITADLLKAKDMALDDMNVKGRANKYAIMSLLADVYLWNEQYQLAADYCDSVTLGGYALEPYESWFNIYYPGNSALESIFEIQYDEALDEERNPIYGGLIPINGTPQLIPSEEIIEELLQTGDIRSCTLGNKAAPLDKYITSSFTSGLERATSEEDANFIYYRYADIILIKAEALNELGQEDAVNELLRLTKERAGLDHINVTGKSDLRTEILQERAREFLTEGKRWFDVLRFAKRENYSTENKEIVADILLAGVNIKEKAILEAYVYDPDGYYLPVPQNDIRYNPELIQNPFYDNY